MEGRGVSSNDIVRILSRSQEGHEELDGVWLGQKDKVGLRAVAEDGTGLGQACGVGGHRWGAGQGQSQGRG